MTVDPNALSEDPARKGLRIDGKRARFAGVERARPPLSRALEKDERRLHTRNQNVTAISAHKGIGSVLRLLNQTGGLSAEIDLAPKSFAPHFIVPSRRDNVWVLAVPPEERGAELRWRPWMEIHVFDFSGRRLASVDARDVGRISMARSVDSGDLIAVQWITEKQMRIARYSPDGTLAAAFPIPFRHVEGMSVFGDGEFISLQTFSWDEKKRRGTLYSRSGSVVGEVAVDVPQHARIPGMTPDLKHYLAVRLDGGETSGELVRIADSATLGKRLSLPVWPTEVVIPNDMRFLALRSLVESMGSRGKYELVVVDREGKPIAQAECADAALSLEPQLDLTAIGIRWLCGDEWLMLEVDGAK